MQFISSEPSGGQDQSSGIRVSFLARPAERVIAFYNQCGTCEQFIKAKRD